MNFIAPKSAEYEALTKMTVIKILKEDYDRAMNDSKIVFKNSTANKLKKQFSIFSDLPPEDLIQISKRVKQKKFNKNEFVTFEGCPPDCIYLVGEGEFRAEREINYNEK